MIFFEALQRKSRLSLERGHRRIARPVLRQSDGGHGRRQPVHRRFTGGRVGLPHIVQRVVRGDVSRNAVTQSGVFFRHVCVWAPPRGGAALYNAKTSRSRFSWNRIRFKIKPVRVRTMHSDGLLALFKRS